MSKDPEIHLPVLPLEVFLSATSPKAYMCLFIVSSDRCCRLEKSEFHKQRVEKQAQLFLSVVILTSWQQRWHFSLPQI